MPWLQSGNCGDVFQEQRAAAGFLQQRGGWLILAIEPAAGLAEQALGRFRLAQGAARHSHKRAGGTTAAAMNLPRYHGFLARVGFTANEHGGVAGRTPRLPP